jgi:hypothetical protein
LTVLLVVAVVALPRFRRWLLALLRLPLSLLPTFLVPLLIADHVVMFWRMTSRRTRT